MNRIPAFGLRRLIIGVDDRPQPPPGSHAFEVISEEPNGGGADARRALEEATERLLVEVGGGIRGETMMAAAAARGPKLVRAATKGGAPDGTVPMVSVNPARPIASQREDRSLADGEHIAAAPELGGRTRGRNYGQGSPDPQSRQGRDDDVATEGGGCNASGDPNAAADLAMVPARDAQAIRELMSEDSFLGANIADETRHSVLGVVDGEEKEDEEGEDEEDEDEEALRREGMGVTHGRREGVKGERAAPGGEKHLRKSHLEGPARAGSPHPPREEPREDCWQQGQGQEQGQRRWRWRWGRRKQPPKLDEGVPSPARLEALGHVCALSRPPADGALDQRGHGVD